MELTETSPILHISYISFLLFHINFPLIVLLNLYSINRIQRFWKSSSKVFRPIKRLVNMTKWRRPKVVVEHDQKFFTLMNLNFWIWPKFMTPTNITLTKKICWCGRLRQVPQPRLASSHWLGHLPSLASLLYKKKKTSGTEISRTPEIKLRFVGFRRFVRFNFGQVQLLRFVVVMIW